MAGTRHKEETATATAAASIVKDETTPTTDASNTTNGGPKPALVKSKFCLNCQKDLTRNIRITCAECVSSTTALPLIELCVECFGVGIELGGHKKTHRYTVSDCLAFPLVRERGAVPSTISLPSAVAIPSAVVGGGDLTNKSSEAITTATTVMNTDASMGTPAKDKDTAAAAMLTHDWTADEELLLLEGIEMFGLGNWKDIAEHIGTKSEKKCELHYLHAYLNRPDLLPRFIDELDGTDTMEREGEADDATGQMSAAALEVATAANAHTHGHADRPSGSELAGYMPLRGDFDVEYENEAELILADMEFHDDDHATERELKLKVIEIYNGKLDERERRKRFVIERGLLDYKKHQQSERRRPKDEREILAQMRPFARFQSPQEHDEFVNGLITAMRLRKQILLLQEYRKNGVRTLAEAELYDAEKKKRETEQALQKQRETNSYLYDSGRPASSGRDRASRMSSRGTDDGAVGGGGGVGGDDASARTTRGSSASTTTSNASTFDLDGTPGAHLLTPNEKELCVKLKLLPKHYLVIKDALVRECYRLGYLTEKTAKEIVKIDVNKTGQIYDFFVECGWVRTEATTTKIPIPTKAKNELPAPTSATAVGNSTPAKRKADEITPTPTPMSTLASSETVVAPVTAPTPTQSS